MIKQEPIAIFKSTRPDPDPTSYFFYQGLV